jgi:hypothetical protein
MPDIQLRFHALPSELLELVHMAVDELGLHLIGVTFPPYRARELARDEIDDAIVSGPYHRFLLTEFPLAEPVHSQDALGEQVPEGLYLDVGRLGSDGLGQSWLAGRTGSAPMDPKWKKIAKALRAMTKAGAVAVAPDGATSPSRSHRYTPGAKALDDHGVTMRPDGGNVVMKLGSAE